MSVEIKKEKPGGWQGSGFCAKPHPTNEDVWCRRQPGHPGDCAAFAFSIKEPESWAS